MWRVLVDENLRRDLAERLRGAGHHAEHVTEAGLRGHPDPDIFHYAQANDLLIVTGDIGRGNVTLYPAPHAGVVVVRLPDTLGIHDRIATILRALQVLGDQSLRDAVMIVEMDRVRVRR